MDDDAAGAAGAGGLLGRLKARKAAVGVIGLGYVGLPLLKILALAGFEATGFDIDPAKPAALTAGRSYLRHIPAAAIAEALATGRLSATTDFSRLAGMDAILICVPTPLTRHREPDLGFVVATARTVALHMRPGALVVLESTTFPGTTREVVRPILEEGGRVCGRDFFLAYSPEREDPGNIDHSTSTIPKLVGGDGEAALALALALYGAIVARTVPMSSPEAAEATKLTENVFRAVNIALVNELKIVYEAMGIDIWEVVAAASTKPFGYMPFYPGPGLGGHCIPIDPFYLTWKAREYGISTRFIELAGEINTAMPARVVARLAEALDRRCGRGLGGSRILVMGIAYKRNVDDMRESPALRIIELLEGRGAEVGFFDPFVPEIPPTREHAALAGRRSVAWDAILEGTWHAAVVVTDHDGVDYGALARAVPLVVDTRNAMGGMKGVVKA